jgi:hypothetical protein
MTSTLRTLLIDANGYGKPPVIIDTVLEGVFGLRNKQLPWGLDKYYLLRMLFGDRYEHLSYVRDWRDAFLASPQLEIDHCNINDRIGYHRCLRRISEYDLIIVLHAAAGDRMAALTESAPKFDARKGKLIVFFGNECDRIKERLDFTHSVQPEIICSQLPIETAKWIYRNCKSLLLAMPHAVNTKVYHPHRALNDRDSDIGFVGTLYHMLIGDRERTDLINYFNAHGAEMGLSCDIRLRTGDLITKHRNLVRNEWSNFLNGCRGIIGAESGPYFIDETGELRSKVAAFVRKSPSVSFEAVYERFFADKSSPVSGKTISSRHFEALGTKTCQVMIEGNFNGILEPNTHYISVKKDLSNISDAVLKFKDAKFREQIAECGYELAMNHHTYPHRVRSLINATSAIKQPH